MCVLLIMLKNAQQNLPKQRKQLKITIGTRRAETELFIVDQLLFTFSRGRRKRVEIVTHVLGRQSGTDWSYERTKTAKTEGACAHQRRCSLIYSSLPSLIALLFASLGQYYGGSFNGSFYSIAVLNLISSILILQKWTNFGEKLLLLW